MRLFRGSSAEDDCIPSQRTTDDIMPSGKGRRDHRIFEYTRNMSVARAFLAGAILVKLTCAQDHVSFPTRDGWTIHGDLYGTADRGVVLAHGGQFEKGSWEKQARTLVNAGFRVLAIDLRGFGLSKEGPQSVRSDFGSPLDVLAAVRYLHEHGAKTVAAVGASMGGDAVEDALGEANPGELDRIVLLAHGAYGPPERLKIRKLFVVSRDDVGSGNRARLTRIRAQYDQAPDPKELVILEGSAHAQFIFQTDQGDRLMAEILRFLTAP
jgi:pimeloyl-ACP methyl ester carboxylesterase